MFGKGKIKPGDYVFVVNKENSYNSILVGRIKSVNEGRLHITGTIIHPRGLIEQVELGRQGRPKEVLLNPDPNNCIFMLIDRIETEKFNGEINPSTTKLIWINEKRYFVLDGWIRENLPDMFADIFRSSTDSQREHARSLLLEKMNSLYEKDLKEHVYSVARSTRVL